MIALATLAALLASAAPPHDGGDGAGPSAVAVPTTGEVAGSPVGAVAGPPDAPSAGTLAAAIAEALTTPGARAEIGEARQTSATATECRAGTWTALRPVAGSGQAALRFSGTTPDGAPCQGFAWAPVRVLAQASVTTRALRAGEPLDGAVRSAEVELRPGHRFPPALPAGAVALRALAAGQPVDEAAFRIGPEPGALVAVRVQAGRLTVDQTGRAIPCARGLACALLPNGRRVEGHLADGRLLVELP